MKFASFLVMLLITLNVFAAKVEVEVQGMTCGMCVEAITRELKSMEKAEDITVSLEDKKARFEEVKGKKISDHEIKNAIKKAGYEAGRIIRR